VGLLSPPVGGRLAQRRRRVGALRCGGGGAAGRAMEAGGWDQGREGAHTTVAAELKTASGLRRQWRQRPGLVAGRRGRARVW
jgi:hypothetical protein